MPVVMQLWLYATPVIYSSSLIPENWRWLYGLNPMVGVIGGFRWALFGTGMPPLAELALSLGVDRSTCRRRAVIQSHGIEICGCGVMSDVAVQAKSRFKEYRITRFQRKKTHERSLRDDVVGLLTSPFRKRDDSGSPDLDLGVEGCLV